MGKYKLRRHNKNRVGLLALGIVVLLLAGGFYAKRSIFVDKVATGGEIIEEAQPTEMADSGEVYSSNDTPSVPDGVDPQSIKNYELVTENEMYKIRKLDNVYTVTLYAIINRPDQAEMYRDQLKEYKGYALEYLRGKGLSPNNLNIVYEPEEATNL